MWPLLQSWFLPECKKITQEEAYFQSQVSKLCVWIKAGLWLVSVNKVLLEDSLAHLLVYCLLFSTIAELSSCDIVYGPQSLKYLLCDSLQKTSTDPCPKLCSFWDSGWPRGYQIGWGCSFWEMKSMANHSQALKALSLAKVNHMATPKSKGHNPSTCLGRKPEILGRQHYWLTHGYSSPFRELLSKYFSFLLR